MLGLFADICCKNRVFRRPQALFDIRNQILDGRTPAPVGNYWQLLVTMKCCKE